MIHFLWYYRGECKTKLFIRSMNNLYFGQAEPHVPNMILRRILPSFQVRLDDRKVLDTRSISTSLGNVLKTIPKACHADSIIDFSTKFTLNLLAYFQYCYNVSSTTGFVCNI